MAKTNLFEMGSQLSSGWALIQEAQTPATPLKSQKEHQLVVTFEKRNGKPVTLVGLFFYEEAALKNLHQSIKKSLACGGAIEDQRLLFQGDHREKVKPLFEKLGWKFKSK